MVIVRHGDGGFGQGLASWLAQRSVLEIEIARPGSTLRPGIVLLAASNDHLRRAG